MTDLEAIMLRYMATPSLHVGTLLASCNDIPALVAEVELLKWDYAEAMCQYDNQQKRACKAEAELARAVTEAREACRQIAEEVALRYSGYGHEPEMDTAIEISNAIKALMC